VALVQLLRVMSLLTGLRAGTGLLGDRQKERSRESKPYPARISPALSPKRSSPVPSRAREYQR
jgi:hypothetical protein